MGDAAERNRAIASALFRAGLASEADLKRELAAVASGDLAAHLVARGLVSAADVARVLGVPAGVPRDETESATVVSPDSGSGGASGSASWSASRPANEAGALERALAVPPGSEIAGQVHLGPFVLQRLIARGGMGAVFVARHATLGRTVALKVLLAGGAASQEQLARFHTEARTASRLVHPNVVPIYEVGEDAGVRFLTMELVTGKSLKQLIREEAPLDVRRALALAEQVARGVAAAHAHGIIHRDLKPENVLVAAGPPELAKVMDFGLAKDVGQADGVTISGAILGTPSYMAPEQAAGEAAGTPADVYGLGAILYESLTGRPPFQGATVVNVIKRVMTEEVEAPRTHRPALNRDVETICLKALEKDPAKRYASATHLADDVARWLAGDAILARPIARTERAARWVRKNLALVLALGAGGALALGTAAWFLAVEPRLRDARERAAREAAATRAREAAGAAASLLVAQARALEASDPAAARAALARAAAADAAGPAGFAALAELALVSEAPGTLAALDDLVATPLPAELVARVRLARAEARAARFQLAGTAADLRELPASPRRERLRRLVEGSLANACAVPAELVGPPPRWIEASGDGELHLIGADGGVRTLAWSAAQKAFVLVRTIKEPRLESKDGELVAVTVGGDASRPLVACFTSRNVLVLWDGVNAARIPRRSRLVRDGLRFVSLGAEPGTFELLCLCSIDHADSVVLTIGPRRTEGRDFDPRGRNQEPPATAATYPAAFANGRIAGKPRLVVSYGFWGAHWLKVFDADVTRPRPPTVVGTATRLALADLDGDGSCEVVAAIEQERANPLPAGVRRTPDGLAVYACDGERVTAPERYHLPPCGGAAFAVRDLLVAHRGRDVLAFFRSEDRDHRDRARWGVAALGPDGGELLLDASAPGPCALRAVGDLDRDGSDDLVVERDGGLVVLGVGAAAAPEPPPAPRPDAELETVTAACLGRLGHEALALDVLRRREAQGAARAAPDEELDLLDRLERAAPAAPDAEFERRLAAFLESAARDEATRARAAVLRARHLVRAAHDPDVDVPAAREAAAAVRRALEARGLSETAAATLRRARALLTVRGDWPGARTSRVSFVAPETGLPNLLANDPVRLRLERRGLVAHASVRAPLLAGVPVDVPSGTVRLAVDFRLDGRTWQRHVLLGLFREGRRELSGERASLEGLAMVAKLWSTGDVATAFFAMQPLAGELSSALDPDRGWVARADGTVSAVALGDHRAQRGAFRAILEHDAPSLWTRFALYDVSGPTPEKLFDEAGTAQGPLPPGPYVLGLLAPEVATSTAGGNFPPEATVVVERLTLDHVSESGSLARLIDERPTEGPLGAARAGGELLLAERRGSGALEASARLAAATARERLLRAAARARLGAPDAADELRRGVEADPLAFLIAADDANSALDAPASAALATACKEALVATNAALVAKPDDVAALVRRVVLEELRGDPVAPEHARALGRLDTAGPDLDRAHLAYLQGTQPPVGARTRPDPAHRRPFWLPLEPVPDLRRHVTDELARASGNTQRIWLDRAVELFPAEAAPWRDRARWQKASDYYDFYWKVIADLRRAVAIEPNDVESLVLLGYCEAFAFDHPPAVEHLRAARALGADVRAIDRTLAKPPMDASDAPARWERLRRAVLD